MLSEELLTALRMTFADMDGWVSKATLNELARQRLISSYVIELYGTTDSVTDRTPVKLTRYRLTDTGRSMLPNTDVVEEVFDPRAEEEAQMDYLF